MTKNSLKIILGITSCFGNVSCDQATSNIGKILNDLGRGDVPFFKGADHSIISREPPATWAGHGTNGLGDSYFPSNPAIVRQDEHAVNALIRCVVPYIHLI